MPYFFQFAKDKKEKQCENVNNSIVNRISKAIKDPKNMFKPIKKLGQIDYHIFIKDMIDNYSNNELNIIFDSWNKKYGNNVKLNEDPDTQKNNLIAIANEVRSDLNKIESDNQKIINSLVKFLYEKPSTRKKKLLWYIYGEELYNNLVENLEASELSSTKICRKCGSRVDKLVDYKCEVCRKSEIKELGGKKIIKCIDCGKNVEVGSKSRKKNRCDDCQKIYRRLYDAERKRKMRES